MNPLIIVATYLVVNAFIAGIHFEYREGSVNEPERWFTSFALVFVAIPLYLGYFSYMLAVEGLTSIGNKTLLGIWYYARFTDKFNTVTIRDSEKWQKFKDKSNASWLPFGRWAVELIENKSLNK